ncbi:MAG: hypothetical protein HKN43_13180 [Rhodothermales bacterium]|nr:hypothetical protein [Rhodothermales bacterium]
MALIAIAAFLPGCDFTPTFSEFDKKDDIVVDENSCGGQGILCNVAGVAGMSGSDGLGGPAIDALLNFPTDVEMVPLTLAQTGEIFVLDENNHAIRRITRQGDMFPFIGTGNQGDGASGTGDQVDLNYPSHLAISQSGHFFVSDRGNSKIKVFNGASLEMMSSYGRAEGLSGDGGPATDAEFDRPSSVVFDPDGLVYVSDQGNQRIRRIDQDEIVSTFAGSSAGFVDGSKEDAQFDFPVAVDAPAGGKSSMNTHDWALYIADTENHSIRRINFITGHVTTVAGTGTAGYSGDGGNARQAQLNYPTDVIFREDHHIYIADSGNNVIRKIDPFGNITTLVGTGEAGYSPDETPATEAKLNTPSGIYYDEVNQTLYIADTYNHQIKRVFDL